MTVATIQGGKHGDKQTSAGNHRGGRMVSQEHSVGDPDQRHPLSNVQRPALPQGLIGDSGSHSSKFTLSMA